MSIPQQMFFWKNTFGSLSMVSKIVAVRSPIGPPSARMQSNLNFSSCGESVKSDNFD